MNQLERVSYTAEHVSEGHPDKYCDQVADRILDKALELAGTDEERRNVRTAIECLGKDKLLIVSGEVRFSEKIVSQIDVHALAQQVWERVGYGKGSDLTVVNHLRNQSEHISQGVDIGGAGDQGIMVGFATNRKVNGQKNTQLMPPEWVLARDICLRLRDLRVNSELRWLKTDCKSQVTLDGDSKITNVIVAAQHEEVPEDGNDKNKKLKRLEELERQIISYAVLPVLFPEVSSSFSIDKNTNGNGKGGGRSYILRSRSRGDVRVAVNGTGEFAIGGTIGDAGVVGRKIVVDAYGPQIPVGGGAYSGKDPTKVDRSAAYMARYVAKTVVAEGEANDCLVKVAYGIGRPEPEMFTVVTDKGDISAKMHDRFIKHLAPAEIIKGFELLNPTGSFEEPASGGWTYFDTAAYGHYGRDIFPWERPGVLPV